MPSIPRRQYAALYGPTVGDRVRLADTSLLLGIERDLLTHGDEAVFGGGKTIRDGMAQRSNATSAGGALATACVAPPPASSGRYECGRLLTAAMICAIVSASGVETASTWLR